MQILTGICLCAVAFLGQLAQCRAVEGNATSVQVAISYGDVDGSAYSGAMTGRTPQQIRRDIHFQIWGKILLAVGIARCITGIAIIEAGGWGSWGLLGFSAVGYGIVTTGTGMILMGVSRPYHGTPVDDPPTVHSDTKGRVVSLGWTWQFGM